MTIEYKDSKRISALSSDYTLGTNNGTIFANWDYILYGGSAEFDGSNDNIKFGDNTDWNFIHNGGSWTASFWMKPDATNDRMVFNTNATTNTNIGVQCIITSVGNLRTRIGNGSGDWVTVTHGSFSVNTWYFVVITFDGTTLSVKSSSYGGSLSSATTGTASGSASSANSLSPMTLGSASDNNTTYPFDGHINVFMIWDRVLTSAEINTLYGGGTGSTSYSESGLVLRTCLQITGESLQWFDNQVVKPTNVQDNSILVEKDTGIRYFSTKAEIAPTTTANFTGSANDHVDIPVSVAMKSFTNGSVAFWMYVNSTTPNSGDNVAFSVSDTTSGSKEWIIGYYGSTNKISLLSRTSSSSKVLEYQAGTLTKDKWYHIVYTNNTSTGNKLYIDGVLTTPSYTAGSASTNCFFNGLNINTSTLGANKDSGGYQWALDGNLQQVLLYNKTLTQSEVNSLYNGGYYNQFPDSINLVRNYELDTNVNNSQAPWDNGTATGITYTSLSIPNRPYTWNMQPISVDFQSNPLTSSSTKVFYNHKTHKIDYDLSGTEVHVGARGTIDLQELNGGALSSSWVLDFDINDTGVIMTSDGRLSTNIGVSTLNVNNSSDTAVGAFVGLHADIDDDNTSRGAYGICAYSTGTGHNPNSHITPFETINQNQHWYVRLIKDGVADTFKAEFYANSERIGTPLSATVTGVTWDTPRYFGVFDDHDLGGTNSHVGNIGQIALYNGVTTVN